MSVATSTRNRPDLNRSSARCRAFCDLFPWMASAVTPVSCELPGDIVRPPLRSGEDQHLVQLDVFQQLAQLVPLLRSTDEQHLLLDERDRRSDRRHGDIRRIAKHRIGEVRRPPAASSQRRTATAARAATEATIRFRSGMKPMSSIRSASSRTQHFDALQADVSLVHQVEQPARRGDEHMHAARQRPHLRKLPHAAVHHGAAEGEMLAVLAETVMNLVRQLTRRREHQHARQRRSGRFAARRRAAAGSAARTRRFYRCRSAQPRRSRPSRTCGIAASWIGVGVVYPDSAIAFWMPAHRGSSAKVIVKQSFNRDVGRNCRTSQVFRSRGGRSVERHPVGMNHVGHDGRRSDSTRERIAVTERKADVQAGTENRSVHGTCAGHAHMATAGS